VKAVTAMKQLCKQKLSHLKHPNLEEKIFEMIALLHKSQATTNDGAKLRNRKNRQKKRKEGMLSDA
jgi:hypothetical protein